MMTWSIPKNWCYADEVSAKHLNAAPMTQEDLQAFRKLLEEMPMPPYNAMIREEARNAVALRQSPVLDFTRDGLTPYERMMARRRKP